MQGASRLSAHFSSVRACSAFNGAATTHEQRPRKMARREKVEENMTTGEKRTGKANNGNSESAWQV
jgi:hypothetical protein